MVSDMIVYISIVNRSFIFHNAHNSMNIERRALFVYNVDMAERDER
jgi:hypothetical protein